MKQLQLLLAVIAVCKLSQVVSSGFACRKRGSISAKAWKSSLFKMLSCQHKCPASATKQSRKWQRETTGRYRCRSHVERTARLVYIGLASGPKNPENRLLKQPCASMPTSNDTVTLLVPRESRNQLSVASTIIKTMIVMINMTLALLHSFLRFSNKPALHESQL
ncbi:hypothetical protein Fmac_006405 [Flemingia macrophylla]|uniref:Secreted protein n=1 Tax=Flemingia macrophylla TaxID=520843 RepID=A0ABD1NAJ8_9FABA